jgi:hypothetical protein
MNEFTPDIGPFVDGCLILQGLFLSVLWVVLFQGWLTRAKRFPGDPGSQAIPGQTRIGIASLLAVLVLGSSVATFAPAHWMLALALAAGTFVSVLDPALALCFSLSMVLIRPWEIMPENPVILAVPKFASLFSFLWLTYVYYWVDRFGIRVNRALVIMVGFVAWLAASCFVTPDPASSLTMLREMLLPTLTLVLFVHQLARNRFAIWALQTTLTIVFTCAGFISLYFYVSGYTIGGRILSFGQFANTNDIAAVMTILLPFGCTAYARARGMAYRAFAAFAVGVSLLVLALAQSRGAVIALGLGVMVYVVGRIKNKGAAVLAVVLIAVTGQVATTLFKRDEGDLGGSTNSRTAFWIAGFRMGSLNPVFGVGFNEFPANLETYATVMPDEQGQHTAHSAWILAFAESGPVGLILFLSMFWFGWLKPAARLRSRQSAWLYAGVMYGASITFLSHTYLMFPYVMVAIIGAAYAVESAAARRGKARRQAFAHKASASQAPPSSVFTTRAGLPAKILR